MALRFTQSKDGVPRATIVTRHRLGRTEMISALCCWLVKDGDGFELYADELEFPELTATQVEEHVRDQYAYRPEQIDYWGDDDAGRGDEIEDWATETVDRLWPGLTE